MKINSSLKKVLKERSSFNNYSLFYSELNISKLGLVVTSICTKTKHEQIPAPLFEGFKNITEITFLCSNLRLELRLCTGYHVRVSFI